MIALSNVSFRFSEANVYSLKDVNLEIPKGECVIFTGRSGSGKTTLTRCINGLIPYFYVGELTGQIKIDKKSFAGGELWKSQPVCGSVFQDPRTQFFTTNTDSEIAFGLENYGVPQKEINRRLNEVFRVLNIVHLQDKRVFKLSSGEKQKIAIASAFALRPKVLVLDEPSANLDVESTMILGNILAELKARGYTIVISEHRLYYLADVVDRIIHLENGRVVWEADKTDVEQLEVDELSKKGLRALCLKSTNRDVFIPIEVGTNSRLKLEVSNLSFSYKSSNRLLYNVGFSASGGEIIGIIGGNGAGKTTLLKILSGLLEHKSGTISINGRPVSAKKRLKTCSFVMQDADHQLYTESVEKEVVLGYPISEDILERSKQVLSELRLEVFANRHPGSLSGGEKQRVVIAASIIKDSPILFLDEPTSGLDYYNMRLVSSILKAQAQNGKIICLISHDYEFLKQTCSRIIQLDKGCVTKDFGVSQDKDFLLNMMEKMNAHVS